MICACGKRLRMSERYKIVKDVQILKMKDVRIDSDVWNTIRSLEDELIRGAEC